MDSRGRATFYHSGYVLKLPKEEIVTEAAIRELVRSVAQSSQEIDELVFSKIEQTDPQQADPQHDEFNVQFLLRAHKHVTLSAHFARFRDAVQAVVPSGVTLEFQTFINGGRDNALTAHEFANKKQGVMTSNKAQSVMTSLAFKAASVPPSPAPQWLGYIMSLLYVEDSSTYQKAAKRAKYEGDTDAVEAALQGRAAAVATAAAAEETAKTTCTPFPPINEWCEYLCRCAHNVNSVQRAAVVPAERAQVIMYHVYLETRLKPSRERYAQMAALFKETHKAPVGWALVLDENPTSAVMPKDQQQYDALGYIIPQQEERHWVTAAGLRVPWPLVSNKLVPNSVNMMWRYNVANEELMKWMQDEFTAAQTTAPVNAASVAAAATAASMEKEIALLEQQQKELEDKKRVILARQKQMMQKAD